MPLRQLNLNGIHEATLNSLPIGNATIFGYNIDDQIYKKAKENFVSNLNGTTLWECFVIASIPGISYITMNALEHYIRYYGGNILNISPCNILRYIYEYFMLIYPMIYVLCNNNDDWAPYRVIGFDLIILGLVYLLQWRSNNRVIIFNWNGVVIGFQSKGRKEFISLYRTSLMILTIISILGIDFVVYPRKYGKCEIFGYSIMDLGVGSFMIAFGMVSPNVLNKKSKFKSVIPLFVFGLLRFVTTLKLDYQQHVSEYGIHWNFWFTMSFVSFINYLLNIKPKNGLIISVVLSIIYQLLLSTNILASFFEFINDYNHYNDNNIHHPFHNTALNENGLHNLTDYILHFPRINFFSANKEGIITCFGFFICYNIGCYMGYHFIKFNPSNKNQLWHHIRQIFSICIIIILLCITCNTFIQPNSRRLANITYILFVLGINIWVIFLFLIPYLILNNPNSSIIFTSIDYNQFFIFLLGNILTGIINISCKTIFARPNIALNIIHFYMLIITISSYILKLKKFRLKL